MDLNYIWIMWFSKRPIELLVIYRLDFYIRFRKLQTQCWCAQHITVSILHFVIWKRRSIQMNNAVNDKYSQEDNHMLWIYFHLWGCSNRYCNCVSQVISWGLSNQLLSHLVYPFQHNTLWYQRKLIPIR